jgi:hypothetical protein
MPSAVVTVGTVPWPGAQQDKLLVAVGQALLALQTQHLGQDMLEKVDQEKNRPDIHRDLQTVWGKVEQATLQRLQGGAKHYQPHQAQQLPKPQ